MGDYPFDPNYSGRRSRIIIILYFFTFFRLSRNEQTSFLTLERRRKKGERIKEKT